ncbi:unnamed protein product [Mytilus coruscus]|uniref:C-type lectin domain-containing protein n=1 Tax=Mytilus coruscus TaxID=42192 RepID=A0A6J8E4Y3_MYTCO|nr:unnamed protein product [Mytilus coruscus]
MVATCGIIRKRHLCCCCVCGFIFGCAATIGGIVGIVWYFQNSVSNHLKKNNNGTPMGCLEGWQRYKGNCYFFSTFNLSWTDAQMNCTNMLSHLTDVDDLEEALYFASLTELFISGDAWIGGRGTNSSNFKWLTGEHDSIPKVMNFTYWAQNKPSSSTIEKQFNSPPSMQNCVHVWKQENYKWNNNFCTKEKQFICKQNKT